MKLTQLLLIVLSFSLQDLFAAKKRARVEEQAAPLLSVSGGAGGAVEDKPATTKPKKKNKEFICGTCGKIYVSRAGFKYHLKTHEVNPTRFVCGEPGCGASFLKNSSLTEHKREVHNGRVYQCLQDGCGENFFNYKKLAAHKLIHAKKIYPCRYDGCEKVYETAKSRCAHEKVKHGIGFATYVKQEEAKGIFICAEKGCGKRFALRSEHLSHKNTHKVKIDDQCYESGDDETALPLKPEVAQTASLDQRSKDSSESSESNECDSEEVVDKGYIDPFVGMVEGYESSESDDSDDEGDESSVEQVALPAPVVLPISLKDAQLLAQAASALRK